MQSFCWGHRRKYPKSVPDRSLDCCVQVIADHYLLVLKAFQSSVILMTCPSTVSQHGYTGYSIRIDPPATAIAAARGSNGISQRSSGERAARSVRLVQGDSSTPTTARISLVFFAMFDSLSQQAYANHTPPGHLQNIYASPHSLEGYTRSCTVLAQTTAGEDQLTYLAIGNFRDTADPSTRM